MKIWEWVIIFLALFLVGWFVFGNLDWVNLLIGVIVLGAGYFMLRKDTKEPS